MQMTRGFNEALVLIECQAPEQDFLHVFNASQLASVGMCNLRVIKQVCAIHLSSKIRGPQGDRPVESLWSDCLHFR